MSPEVIVIGLIALPVVLLFLLRVHAALVFLSLCLGAVLVQYAGEDAATIFSGAAPNMHTTDSFIKLGLLVVPALLTMLFMIHTVHGKPKQFLNILPAAGVGMLAVLLVVPLLPPGLSHNIVHSNIWRSIQPLESGIVAISTLICLLFLWLQRPKHHSEDKKHGKKHK